MKKVISTIFSLLLVVALLISVVSCTKPTEEPTVTEAPKATDSNPTTEPTATPVPTDTPEPTATPVPKQIAKVEGLDAIITSFEYCDEEAFGDLEEVEIGSKPFALISAGSYLVYLCDQDGMYTSASMDEYPIISLFYRVGYGGSIGGSDHIYALSETITSPIPEEGKWADQEFICDADWHVLTYNAKEAFTTVSDALTGFKMYANAAVGEPFALAYVGAFKSEEDAQKYYNAFSDLHKEDLVKSEPAKVEKKEVVLDAEDKFDDALIDFEEYDSGEQMDNNVPDSYGWCRGANHSTYENGNGGTVANLAFDAFYYDGFVKAGTAYTLSLLAKNCGGAENFGGILINWGNEKNQDRNFFENNGLKKDGQGSLCGFSGIAFNFIGANEIEIVVYTVENARTSYKAVTVPVTADLKADFRQIVIADNGKDTITLTIADELVATIKYARPEMLGSDVTAYNERYYRDVKVLGKDGTEVLSVDNAIMSVYKSIGFGSRAHGMHYDNIQVK